MSDEKKVIDMATFRRRKQERNVEVDMFAFEPVEDISESVGLIDDDEHPICLILGDEKLKGFALSRETAEALGRELIECSKTFHPVDDGEPD